MSDIHHLILVHGVDGARDLAQSKHERSLIDIAARMMAEEKHTLGSTHAGFALTSLPHRSIDKAHEPDFHRKEGGNCTLIVQSGRNADGSLVGVPYGAKARMILIYLQTQALRTQSRQVTLGRSWHAWMRSMGEQAGGKNYKLLAEQAKRISACSLQFIWGTESGKLQTRQNGSFVRNSAFTLSTKEEQDQNPLFEDMIELDEVFYKSLVDHAVPVSEAALRCISNSSTAIDIYIWLAYRLHVLMGPTPIRWAALKQQFGADYGKLSHWKPMFIAALQTACAVYPEAKVDIVDDGLILHPSRPPIAPRLVG